MASEVWKEMDLGLPALDHPTRDFIDVVWFLKERKGSMNWELFAIMAWHIWSNRNAFKHKGRCKEAKRIAKEEHEYGLELREFSVPLLRGMALARNQWRPPR